jgi:hypothetical protein
VDVIATGLVDGPDFVAELGEVGREDGRGDFKGVGHGSPDFS